MIFQIFSNWNFCEFLLKLSQASKYFVVLHNNYFRGSNIGKCVTPIIILMCRQVRRSKARTWIVLWANFTFALHYYAEIHNSRDHSGSCMGELEQLSFIMCGEMGSFAFFVDVDWQNLSKWNNSLTTEIVNNYIGGIVVLCRKPARSQNFIVHLLVS